MIFIKKAMFDDPMKSVVPQTSKSRTGASSPGHKLDFSTKCMKDFSEEEVSEILNFRVIFGIFFGIIWGALYVNVVAKSNAGRGIRTGLQSS